MGRTYADSPDVDGKVYFTASKAETGKYYDVLVERIDEADLYGQAKER
mgnify:CR=1 FL=1